MFLLISRIEPFHFYSFSSLVGEIARGNGIDINSEYRVEALAQLFSAG